MRLRSILVAVSMCAIGFLPIACAKQSSDSKADQAIENKVVAYTPFPDITAEELAKAFTAKTGIKVEQILEGTTKVFARLRAEKRNPRADVWYGGGGMIPFMTATKEGLLEPYIPTEHKNMPVSKGNLIMRDKNWNWAPIGIISLGFCYNPKVLPADQVPKTWDDLANPKWNDGIEMWDPAESGTGMLFLESALLRNMGANGDETKGWQYLTGYFKNLKRYTKEGKPAFSVARGETRIGIHFEHQYLEFLTQQAGDTQLADVKQNIQWVLPPQSPVIVDSIALVKGGPNPEAGKKFIDFCLSHEGQKIVNRFFFSIYPELPPPANLGDVTLDTLMDHAQKLDVDWMSGNYDRVRKKWQNDVEATAEE